MIKQLNRKGRINLVPFPSIAADRLKMSVVCFIRDGDPGQSLLS